MTSAIPLRPKLLALACAVLSLSIGLACTALAQDFQGGLKGQGGNTGAAHAAPPPGGFHAAPPAGTPLPGAQAFHGQPQPGWAGRAPSVPNASVPGASVPSNPGNRFAGRPNSPQGYAGTFNGNVYRGGTQTPAWQGRDWQRREWQGGAGHADHGDHDRAHWDGRHWDGRHWGEGHWDRDHRDGGGIGVYVNPGWGYDPGYGYYDPGYAYADPGYAPPPIDEYAPSAVPADGGAYAPDPETDLAPDSDTGPPPGAAGDGSNCRPYQSTVTVNGQPQAVDGTACQQPDGSWRIVQ